MTGGGITLLLRRLPGGEDIPLPSYASDGASGMDVRAAISEDLEIQSGRFAVVPCGFAVAVPPGYELQVRPRSGLAGEHGVSVLNSPGTVDADYRGEVRVILINHGHAAFTVSRGMRIAQVCLSRIDRAILHEVGELPRTARGIGGMGHTGEY